MTDDNLLRELQDSVKKPILAAALLAATAEGGAVAPASRWRRLLEHRAPVVVSVSPSPMVCMRSEGVTEGPFAFGCGCAAHAANMGWHARFWLQPRSSCRQPGSPWHVENPAVWPRVKELSGDDHLILARWSPTRFTRGHRFNFCRAGASMCPQIAGLQSEAAGWGAQHHLSRRERHPRAEAHPVCEHSRMTPSTSYPPLRRR